MLEFNQEHKSVDLSSIKLKIDKAKKIGKVMLCRISVSAILLFSGCAKTMDCSRQDRHFQIYTKDGIIKIIDSEKENIGGFIWTEKTVDYSIELENELKLLDKYGLIKISDNYDYFENHMNNNVPYTQYEYTYSAREIDYYVGAMGIQFTPVSSRTKLGANGKITIETIVNTPVYKTVEKTGWSNDANVANFTGNMRDVFTKYCAYKLVDTKEGLEKSPEVDNILDIASEYQYFKLNDYCVERYVPHEMNKIKQK